MVWKNNEKKMFMNRLIYPIDSQPALQLIVKPNVFVNEIKIWLRLSLRWLLSTLLNIYAPYNRSQVKYVLQIFMNERDIPLGVAFVV